MAPVMWALLQLAHWADRLFAWQYSPEYFSPPTAADFTRAAIVFWGALLTPIFIGLVAAIVAFRKKYQPRWPILESLIVAFPYLPTGISLLSDSFHQSNTGGNTFFHAILTAFFSAILWACLLVGGAIVICLLNLGACIRQRTWGKCAVVVVVLFAGVLYLFWLYSFIIYIDT